MTTPIAWKQEMEFAYGKLQQVTPSVRRLVCPNPSAFTLHGTGTYVIGEGRVIVVDPGPDMPGHIESLLQELGDEQVEAIAVTHTHRDHSPGAALLKEKTGAKTYAFGRHGEGRYARAAEVEAGADTEFVPDERITTGDELAVDDTRLVALHTPGHCHNHLCFEVPGDRALLTGDHVMGWSTTVVSPPDGDMGAYLESLRILLRRDDALLIPSHGPAMDNPRELVMALIEHRLQREDQIRACLREGALCITDMVARMYRDVPTFLHPAAARSVLAHALHMLEKGEVICDGPPSVETLWHPLQLTASP